MKFKKDASQYKAVIFDLDGTLVDSMWIWEELDKVYLSARGIKFDNLLLKDIEGMSTDEVAIYFKERFKIEESIEEMHEVWFSMAKEYYCEKIDLKPGVLEFLKRLKDRGIKIGLATSNFAELAELVLNKHGVREYFEAFRTSGELGKGKPEPDVFLKVAEDLGINPSDCLVFEDTHAGVKGAINAKMDVYSVYDLASSDYKEEIENDSIDMIHDYFEFQEFFFKE